MQATSLASITQNKLQNAILSNANLCKTSKNDPWYSENHSKSQVLHIRDFNSILDNVLCNCFVDEC